MRRPTSPRSPTSRSRAKTARNGAAPNALGAWAELITDAVIATQGGRIQALNRAGRDLLGAGRRSPLGQPLAGYIAGPEGERLVTRGFDSLAKGCQPKALALVGKGGKTIPVELRAARLGKAADGCVLVMVRAAKQSRSESRTSGALKQAVDAIPDAVLAADAGGTIRLANPAAASLFGQPAADLLGQPVEALLPGWRPARSKASRPKLNGRSASPAQDIAGRRADGSPFPAELTVGAAGTLIALIVRDVTARHAAEKAARAQAERLAREAEQRTAEVQALSRQHQRILEAASDGIIAVGLDGAIHTANRAAADMLNRDISGLNGLPIDRAFIHGSGATTGTPGRPAPLRAQLWTGPHHVPLEARLARTDGESFDAEYTLAPITEGRQTQGYVITFRDITERKRAEAEMRLASTVFEHAREGLLIADARGRITKTNPAFCRITGFDTREVIGQSIADVLFAEAKASPGVMDPLRTITQTEWEQWCKNKAGKRYAARITMSVVRDPDGQVQQYAAIISDITQRKVDEEKILYQANYDQLTGLANRTLFMDRLTRLVVESKRAKTNVGLMFIDLDGFKVINDTLGHDAGDLLLKGCARRLEKCVRESDTVARLGGDEFTVIMPLIDSLEAAAVVADRIIRSLEEPFDLDGREGKISSSIGISVLPTQASDASSLLHNADVAMYHAKRQGKANYQFYKPGLEANPARA